jgi:hypothetical protein
VHEIANGVFRINTPVRLAGSAPQVLACMHGSAWRGDGAALLRELARSVSADRRAN